MVVVPLKLFETEEELPYLSIFIVGTNLSKSDTILMVLGYDKYALGTFCDNEGIRYFEDFDGNRMPIKTVKRWAYLLGVV
jgi:hypothetical protein